MIAIEKVMQRGSLCLLVGIPVGVIVGILVFVRLLPETGLVAIFPLFIAGTWFLFTALRRHAKDTDNDFLGPLTTRSLGVALLFLCVWAVVKMIMPWLPPETPPLALLEGLMLAMALASVFYGVQFFLFLSRIFSQLAVERESQFLDKGRRFLEVCLTLYVVLLATAFIAFLLGFVHLLFTYILSVVMVGLGVAIATLFWLTWFFFWQDCNKSPYAPSPEAKKTEDLTPSEASKSMVRWEE